ncbi:Rab-like protein 3 [Marchantia polymorpha subsp. ruderalis]|uniref:Uncharacterized protein n=2 Tax=Marchantia polymorpha TaxID=3197 RepID=A0AAF6BV96_MARPO|nr:hypothetical protein MARPO_0088s0081 [Marchantia polymorpha]BBN15930.1 hypothetical protein Mp_7g02050 [Marchantia polymorpha subsp. ruderalis]|eukprot:PTQ33541.1 hypothetical protein MARPO_0088s0081 [Marchantia polymorpha]
MIGKLDGGRDGVAPTGQVRVLVLGDAGVGKTSLIHLIVNESPITNPRRTIGCAVDVKHLVYKEPITSPFNSRQKDREFFVELWDVSGHEQYRQCRSLFYSQINGVIFVHDLSQRNTKASLQGWANEVASLGTFSAPLPHGQSGTLPVPSLVIGNKSDIAPKNGVTGSSSNLVDAARQWVEKQGLLTPSDELPTTQTFPSGRSLHAAAKEGNLDMESVRRFFLSLIRRRYYSEDLQASSPVLQSWDRPTISRSPAPVSYHSRNSSLGEIQYPQPSTYNGSPYNGPYNGPETPNNVPWSRQQRLSPPHTPSPEQPFSQDDFLPVRTSSSAAAYSRSGSSSHIDIHL